ncbi:MAG: hypothetical protein V4612_06585 [Pseudomonadota bacterium]
MTYQVLISAQTQEKIKKYKANLASGKLKAGAYLEEAIGGQNLQQLSDDQFLELLIQTKKPQIFAESAVYGDGRDWNSQELGILGDINFAVPVEIYDNGVHKGAGIKSHSQPFQGELLFVPGALLANGKGVQTADMAEVAKNGQIDDEAFYQLYERRLLPSLLHANNTAGADGAFVTIPGMGCGVFAGQFKGQLEAKFQGVLVRLLETHGDKLQNIKGINFDPNEPQFAALDGTQNINGIELTTKAGKFGAENSQLKKPEQYDPKFAGCKFFSIVAWDHVSWPGNDFYVGGRQTDDGVKAAATNVCQQMTSESKVQGTYDHQQHKFQPSGFSNWNEVIQNNNLQLETQGKVQVVDLDSAQFQKLDTAQQQVSSKQTPATKSFTTSFKPKSHDGFVAGLINDRGTAHPFGTVTLYSAKQHEEEEFAPRLAIKFESPEKRDKFMKQFNKLQTSTIEDNPNVLYIDPSNGVGTTGSYVSKNGELSVNLGDNKTQFEFCSALGITNNIALMPSPGQIGSDAIYFKQELLPPKPDQKTNVKIDAQPQQKSALAH